ncbi:NHL repeat containing protein [Maridesulfovibrio salexigens]|uniref:NHL repeat containing protein n=1 Tax=Maridesulfovibrio salexigens (strain ATCC 14822 / DSM 2638 / NCIMB 8403 / VKM B-1763) TaxID=526222 RepID=C6BZ15_MARSD|nr:NHL repeat containing protein [Maridesulfovibrio salexigens]ACS78839.1 NHL repeat containing protein [Maridesulfovibrio salexigens DSM 2638]
MSRSFFYIFLVFLIGLAGSAYAEDLYIADHLDGSITVIDSEDHPVSGAPVSKQHISGDKTGLSGQDVFGLLVYNNELFATNDGTGAPVALLVFDAAATGNVEPKRKITSLKCPRGVAAAGSELFVGDIFGRGFVKVFNITDSGDVAPKRTISSDTLNTVWKLAVSGSEVFVSSGSKIYVFDKTANSNVEPKRVIEHKTLDFSNAIGLAVEGGFVYVGDAHGRIMVFPISSNGEVEPIATISGTLTGIANPFGIVVKNGYIYASEYNNNKINVFKTTDNGNVAPQWKYSSADFPRPLTLAMESGGYVRTSEHQQSGVNVSLLSNTENATTDSVLQQTYHIPPNFELRAPVGAFTATVDSNGANGVFRFNSTSLNGTTGDVRLYKCFDTNGTCMAFGSYSTAIDPDTEGAWWLEDDNGNYIDPGATLTQGTNYWVNYVVKDNGIYDEDRALGAIKDPAALGSVRESNGGCVMNPAAGFGLEWVLLAFVALVGIISRRK